MIDTKREPIGKYLSIINRKGNVFITKEISKFGIGSGQVMFLMELYKKDGISQEELSEGLNIDKATTCRAIKKLEEAEFMEYLKQLKLSEFYDNCLTVIGYGLNKFSASFDFYKTVFPIITSCYRAVGQPQKAIDFWMENKQIFTFI